MQTANLNNYVRRTPVTVIISAILVVVSLLFIFRQWVNLPCGHDVLSAFSRNFIHVDPLHLIINLYGFYRLSDLEFSLGSIRYLVLILVLSFFQTVLEWLYLTIRPLGVSCSIGFSGILFGILTFMFFFDRGIDFTLLSALLLSIVSSAATDRRISFTGHLFGVIAGLLTVCLSRILGDPRGSVSP